MINNFLIISCIGNNDKLGLRINKDFFIQKYENRKNLNDQLVQVISNFLNAHSARLDKRFSVIVNQGPGSFSGIRIAIAVAKGLKISRKVMLFGYRNNDLKQFNQENIEKLFKRNLIEKNLIKPIYLS